MAAGTLRSLRALLAGGGAELKFGFATGVAANTNMTITGIKTRDQIVFAFLLREGATAGTAIISDQTANVSITAADTIQCTAATNAVANSQVLIAYWSVP